MNTNLYKWNAYASFMQIFTLKALQRGIIWVNCNFFNKISTMLVLKQYLKRYGFVDGK